MNSKRIANLCGIFFILIVTIICSILLMGTCPFNSLSIGTDSSVFHYVARVINLGGMPYRDTFDHKGPIIYLINAFGMCIHPMMGVWIIETIFLFFTFLFSYKTALLLGCNRLVACFVITLGCFYLASCFEGGNLTEEYAICFICISFFIFLRFFIQSKVSPVALIVCGVSFAIVCLLRLNMIALWVVMCTGVLFVKGKDKQWRELISYIAWFLLGLCVVLVPVIFWLFCNNAFNDFINDYILFNILYSTDPVRASVKNIFIAMYTFTLASFWILFAFSILICFCIKSKSLCNILGLSGLILSIYMSCISGQQYLHYGIVFFPFIVYIFSIALKEIQLHFSEIDERKKDLFSMFIISSFILLGIRFSYTTFRTIVPSSPSITENYSLIETIQKHTHADDMITVVGNNDLIYLASNRKSASKYSYQFPIALVNSSIISEYIDEIKNTLPAMIILSNSDIIKDRIQAIPFERYRYLSEIDGYEVYLLNR